MNGVDFSSLSLGSSRQAPTIQTKRFTPPVKFAKDPMEYWESSQYLGMKGNLSRTQKRLLETIYADWPNIPYNNVNIVAGQRCGKTTRFGGPSMSWYAHWALSFDPYDGGPQEQYYNVMRKDRLSLVCLACSEEQAGRTIFSDFSEILSDSPFWRKYIQWLIDLETEHRVIEMYDPGSDSMTTKRLYRNDLYSGSAESHKFRWVRMEAELQNTNSASAAGRTAAWVGFDETARLQRAGTSMYSSAQRMTAEAIVQTMKNALRTVGRKGMFLSISSPQQEDDYSIELFSKCDVLDYGDHSKQKFRDVIERKKSESPTPNSIAIHRSTRDMLDMYDLSHIEDPKKREMLKGLDESLHQAQMENPEAYERDFEACPIQSSDRFFSYPDRYVGCMDDRTNMFDYHEVQREITVPNASDQFSSLWVTGLSIEQVLRRFEPQFPSYWHGDGGKSRNSFVIAGCHAEPVFFDGRDMYNDFINPFAAIDSADQHKTVVDFVLEWVPGKKVLQGETRTERFQVHFENVEQIVNMLLDMHTPQAFTYDNWAGTAGYMQAMMSRGINSYEFRLMLEHWEEFRRRIYNDNQLFQMFDDRNDIGVSRSYEQLKRAVPKNKSMDFLPMGPNDESHGDVITAICACDAHVVDMNANRLVSQHFQSNAQAGSVGIRAGLSGSSLNSNQKPYAGTLSPVGSYKKRANAHRDRRMRGRGRK